MFFDFLKYYLRSVNAHGIHSPFIFELYTKVYKDFSGDFSELEKVREELRKDQRILEITDFGAGSKVSSETKRTIADISKKSLKSSFWSRFFYKIIQYYKYQNILELGTSLGLTTSYLAQANTEGRVWSFEGCANTIGIARENLAKLNLNNVNLVEGNIDDTLASSLSSIESLDFVLFDANHRYEPTLRYFEMCSVKAHENSIFIFDDIYWSQEMKEAWKEIKKRSILTVDFFHVGLVFFKKGIEKQDFMLK